VAANDSSEWQDLRAALESVSSKARAFSAYVFDAWGKLCCAAHGFSEMPRDDLFDLIRAAVARSGTPLQRGGALDSCLSGRTGHAYLKTFGSCYVLELRYAGPFDHKSARAAVAEALPAIEALTLRLPPPGRPGGHASEASKRA
jgi:hypothetical protein